MTEDNIKEIALAFFNEIWNQKDESAIDRFIAETAAGNDPDFGMGREGFRKQWKEWVAAFPDLHFEVTDLIAEGDKVVSRWTFTGTQTGEFMGRPGDGRKIEVEGMSLDRIVDGWLVEGFDGWDNYGFRKQLGIVD